MDKKYPIEEQKIFADAWNLLVQAYNMQDLPQNWDLLIDKAEELSQKYQGADQGLACDLLIAVEKHLERIRSKSRLNEKKN